MKYEKIFSNSLPKKTKIVKNSKTATINLSGEFMNFNDIYLFECHILYLLKKKINIIYINLEFSGFLSSAVLILLEYIIANLCMNKLETELYICNRLEFKSFGLKMYNESILKKFITNQIPKDEYINRVFEKRNNFIGSHSFRWYISIKDSKTETVSIMSTELEMFLNSHHFKEDVVDNVIEIVSELVSNSMEHAKSDVIIQCFIYERAYSVLRKEECDLIDISIVNISNVRLYTLLKNRFYKDSTTISKKVEIAYSYHKNHFTKDYDEDCFFILSTFQNRVTTRNEKLQSTGGTGLTTFIHSIAPFVNEDYCFLISGNHYLNFDKKFLKTSGDYVGFNKQGNYINDIPDDSIFKRINTNFRGTIYNILLDCLRSEDDENN